MTVRQKSRWKWRQASDAGIWSHGVAWARPLCAAAPWLSLALLAALFALASKRVAAAPGTVFDLPRAQGGAYVESTLTAFVLSLQREGGNGEETLVFFDDARFTPADAESAAHFTRRLSAHVSSLRDATLLLLADRRVSAGDLMHVMALARAAGVRHVQIAERRD